MYEVEMFPSRFYIMTDAFKHKVLMGVLNTIKKDTENLITVSSPIGGPTYKTNFNQKAVHADLFIPIIEHLNKLLIQDNIFLELIDPFWYAEYGECDFHEPHIHSGECVTQTPNSFLYSGIICLSNFGETSFINPNSSSISLLYSDGITTIPSEYNKVILFPSNIYHYVTPHGLKDKTRAVFSFNCILKIGT